MNVSPVFQVSNWGFQLKYRQDVRSSMSANTLRERACRALNSNPKVAVPLALLLGLVGVGLFVGNLQAGESLGEQAWFLAFLIAYVIGVRPLVAQVRRE
jgi:hypothetical protein